MRIEMALKRTTTHTDMLFLVPFHIEFLHYQQFELGNEILTSQLPRRQPANGHLFFPPYFFITEKSLSASVARM